MIPRTHDINRDQLFELKTGLITSRLWSGNSTTDRAGDHDVMVSYQTDNITGAPLQRWS